MRIRLESIGCRLNISEIESCGRAFAAAGHRIVGPGDAAELVVFNTCAVTGEAGRKSRQIVRQLRRALPQAALVVTGCYATLRPGVATELGADLVVPNDDKDDLPRLLADAGILRDADAAPSPDGAAVSISGARNRTRAFVKVQDGCENRCTFCIVTVARGKGRSRSVRSVVEEVQRLVAAGYREVVISGVHLGSYGSDRNDPRGLHTLVQSILGDTDLARLRLSSLEPWDLNGDFFALWEDARLLPHLHLPLQSGCDATLQRMARRTDQRRFSRLVKQARAAIPDVSITTDIIVGFPGETEAEFTESLAFVEVMEFARLHIFRYSRRAGTTAASMPGQAPSTLAQARSRRMHALGAQLERSFQNRFLGRTLPVLWEHCEELGDGKRWSGLTDNYLRVVIDTSANVELQNSVLEAKLVEALPGTMVGDIPDLRQGRKGAMTMLQNPGVGAGVGADAR